MYPDDWKCRNAGCVLMKFFSAAREKFTGEIYVSCTNLEWLISAMSDKNSHTPDAKEANKEEKDKAFKAKG